MNKKRIRLLCVPLLGFFLTLGWAGPASIAAEGVERAYAAAMRASGGRFVESTTAQAMSKASIERLAVVHGERVLDVVGQSGIEFLQASSRYGDEFVSLAMKASPAAQRMLAINPAELIPLAREFGGVAIEAEAKAPGLGRRLFEVFGKEEGARLVAEVPAADLPRLIAYGEKSMDAATRQALLGAYRKEGGSLFRRIPPGQVLEAGLSITMIIGAVGVLGTFRAVADFIREHPYLFMIAVVLSSGVCVAAWRFSARFRPSMVR